MDSFQGAAYFGDETDLGTITIDGITYQREQPNTVVGGYYDSEDAILEGLGQLLVFQMTQK